MLLLLLFIEFLLADAPNVRHVPGGSDQGFGSGTVVALVQAKMLRCLVGRLRTLDNDGFDRCL